MRKTGGGGVAGVKNADCNARDLFLRQVLKTLSLSFPLSTLSLPSSQMAHEGK